MSLTLQENLMEFSPYNIDFKIQNGWVIISVIFDKDWTIIKPDNEKIDYVEDNGRHYYGALLDNDNSYINDIFELIRQTIIYNKDLEKKVTLFQQKVKELQEIFSVEKYEDLLKIEFVLRKKKKKNKIVSGTEIDVPNKEVDDENKNTEPIKSTNEQINSDVSEKPINLPPIDDGVKYVNVYKNKRNIKEDVKTEQPSIKDLENFINT